MKRTSRRLWMGLLLGAGISAAGLVGCSSSGGHDLGQMTLPLTTQGASGLTYRLRDATFVVQNQSSAYDHDSGGAAGSSGTPGTVVVVVSSETNPDAATISLSLEEGNYNVRLLPGWRMERVKVNQVQTVEATLLSGSSQWVWVSRQATSWAEYSFGIGGSEVWFNGKLNIAINVQEVPGAGGEGGVGGASGFPAGAGGEAG